MLIFLVQAKFSYMAFLYICLVADVLTYVRSAVPTQGLLMSEYIHLIRGVISNLAWGVKVAII